MKCNERIKYLIPPSYLGIYMAETEPVNYYESEIIPIGIFGDETAVREGKWKD